MHVIDKTASPNCLERSKQTQFTSIKIGCTCTNIQSKRSYIKLSFAKRQQMLKHFHKFTQKWQYLTRVLDRTANMALYGVVNKPT